MTLERIPKITDWQPDEELGGSFAEARADMDLLDPDEPVDSELEEDEE